MFDLIQSESDHPDITERILNKSISCVYQFGLITKTENRIHFYVLKEYRNRWITKSVLNDLTKLCISILKQFGRVYGICSPNNRAIIKLMDRFGFNFNTNGEYNNLPFVLYELKGINNVR